MPTPFLRFLRFLIVLLVAAVSAQGAEPAADTSRGDRMIADYFRTETARLAASCLAHDRSLAAWQSHRGEYRRQLLDMLGLDPLPEKTDLHATVTGVVEHAEFQVEKIHFQSSPGLYVTGNLYLPRSINGRLPAILYVCGHGGVKKGNVSYGNKVTYQHHGGWFARNGYVCLIIDTLQLGEIEGIHHGTYRYGMWWWLNRGYTSAGVEAWNCIRALDYLQSRPEVDASRIGVTGRSGGGAYSWWIAAVDERIQCAVPVAGITDLTNHIVDGCVEGHCDCMYMVNTHRWDYPLVAALVAPRPLLISNTDSDRIFPLDGVVRLFERVRGVYGLQKAADKVALNITAGGHKDTQELQVHAFRWFNHHLKNDDSLVEKTAVKFFEPEQLRVFTELPKDEKNTQIQETFIPAAVPPAVPQDRSEFTKRAHGWLESLRTRCFAGWPTETESLQLTETPAVERDGLTLRACDFTSQGAIRLRLYLVQQAELDKPNVTVLNVLDDGAWSEFLATLRPAFEQEFQGEALPPAHREKFQSLRQLLTGSSGKFAMAYVAPRGIGPTAWDASERKQVQHQRRFYLLGQTLDGMRVWDVRRAIQALRSLTPYATSALRLRSHRNMAGNTLYASLFEPEVASIELYDLPRSHRNGPFFLNVERFLDMPQTVAMAASRNPVVLYQDEDRGWDWPRAVAQQLDWNSGQLQLRQPNP